MIDLKPETCRRCGQELSGVDSDPLRHQEWDFPTFPSTGYYARQIRRDKLPGVKRGSVDRRPAWAKLLPEYLRSAGYRSYHSGKWHIADDVFLSGLGRQGHSKDCRAYSWSYGEHRSLFGRGFGLLTKQKIDERLTVIGKSSCSSYR